MNRYESVWREFEANEVTHSAAHYLLAIASLQRARERPRAADVARVLGVSRAAVSLQLKSLKEQQLVRIDRGHRLALTRQGNDLVARIASKREVLRVLFAEVLGVEPSAAEQDACKMEHLISEESVAALVRLLRFLRSNHPKAVECLRAFRDLTAGCPSGQR
jgi:Mn-dependent DtxR family transcriptional regulator